MAAQLGVDRSTATRWVAEYAKRGLPALSPRKAPGPRPKLSEAQLKRLTHWVEAGPIAAGFESAIWTARMIATLIKAEFKVTYHWKWVPQVLHRLGFSVQRPRKLLARADHAAQERWLSETLPAIKKKPVRNAGWFSSRMRRASSSIPRSIERGHGEERSLECQHAERGRRRMSTAP